MIRNKYGNDYYDRNGNPLPSIQAWSALHKNREYQSVSQTEIDEDVRVSTVWLGLDHNFYGEGPPLIFETMIFGGPLNDYQERYSTEEQARTGHNAAVKLAIQAQEGMQFS